MKGKTTIKIEGNKDIKIGENVVKVTATAEDGTSRIYTINIKNEEAIFGLESLTVDGKAVKDFKTDKFEYEIDIDNLDKLDIKAKATEEGATIEILGNEDLQEGENLITIMVTSKDSKKTATYQIKANKLALVEQKQEKKLDLINIAICAIIALIVLIIIILLIMKYVSNKNDEEDDYDNFNDDDYNPFEDGKKEEIITAQKDKEEFADDMQSVEEPKKQEDKKYTVDNLFENDDDDTSSRRGRGKHSK